MTFILSCSIDQLTELNGFEGFFETLLQSQFLKLGLVKLTEVISLKTVLYDIVPTDFKDLNALTKSKVVYTKWVKN